VRALADGESLDLGSHRVTWFDPSEGMRHAMDYFAHGRDTRRHLEKLAVFEPRVLACMHGSAFAGDGRAQLLALAAALDG
jgi:hypothetical protein